MIYIDTLLNKIVKIFLPVNMNITIDQVTNHNINSIMKISYKTINNIKSKQEGSTYLYKFADINKILLNIKSNKLIINRNKTLNEMSVYYDT